MKKVIFVNIGMMMFRGGGENFDLNMSKALKELGYEVEIYSLKPLFAKSRFDNVASHFDKEYFIKSPWLYPITQLFHKNKYLKKLRGLRGIPRILGQLIFELRVFNELRKRDDEYVVHTCELPVVAYLVSKYTNNKAYMRLPGPLDNFYDIFFAKGCSGIVANGDAYKKTKALNIVNDKLHFINIGVYEYNQKNIILKEKFRTSLNIAQDDFIILFVGRLIDIKNIPMLLKGFSLFLKHVSKTKLILVGDGNKKDNLVELSEDLNILEHTIFTGSLEKYELANYYNIADCFALTSHYDNFPNVLIEAMSFGIPCIGTNVGGIPDIIEDGKSGYIVDVHDENMLVEKLLLLHSENLNIDTIKNYVKDTYSWNKSAIKLKELINC